MPQDELSILVKGEDGARANKLTPNGKLVKFFNEDAKTLIECIQRGCKISGNGRCLGWRSSKTGYSWLTYKEFMKRAENFGFGLMGIGADLGQSSFIGIYSQNSVEWLVAQYGCLFHSSPIIPLFDTLGPEACSFMINQAAIRVIVCDTEKKVQSLLDGKDETPTLKHIICMSSLDATLIAAGKQKQVNLHLFQDIENLGKKNPVPNKVPKPSDVACVCYTSGTTGNPKGVVLTHENIVSGVQAIIALLGSISPNKTDTAISYLPLAHVFEQALEALFFFVGGSIGFFGGDLLSLLDDVKVLQPTLFPAVPRMLNKIYEKVNVPKNTEQLVTNENGECEKEQNQGEADLDPNLKKFIQQTLGGKIKLIIAAAAPISDKVLRFFKEALQCQVAEFYGQTEASGPISGNILTETSFGNVGTPVPSCMVKLVDVPELGYYAKENKGEVCVKGYNVFQAYYKDPQKTEETIDKKGWLHSGDIGMWLPNGTLKIIDRKKDIFKLSQGEYIAPAKLETLYLQSPYVSQILIHGNSLQNYVIAVVVPDEQIIMTWCKDNVKCLTFEEACEKLEVKQLILKDMKRIAEKEKLLSFEQVKKIYLHPKILTFDEGFLTPTSKIKRAICLKYFEKELQDLYDNNES